MWYVDFRECQQQSTTDNYCRNSTS